MVMNLLIQLQLYHAVITIVLAAKEDILKSVLNVMGN